MASLSPNAQRRRRALLALVFLSALLTPAPLRAQKRGAAPGVGIRASKNIVIACPGDDASARVRLRAVVDDASCATRYTWSATGGRVLGEGPEVVWDFSGTPPNGRYYDITLTVESKPGCGPRRAVSAPARVILWGCAPRINVVEVYGCPASCPTGTADKQEPEPTQGETDAGKTATGKTETEKRLLNLNASVRNARDGRPVPGARVSFFLDGRPVGEAAADAGGRFLREGLAPGIYQFVASADSFDELKSTVTLDQYSSGSVVISLLPTHVPPTPASSPAPPASPSPTPSPSPDASPTPLVVLSHTPDPRPTSEATPTPDQTVEPKGWVWLPWALAAAGLAAAAGIAYLMLKGGAAASSTAGAAESSLAAAGATKQSDKVYCTVFAPRSAPPGRKFITQVFAHLKEQEEQLAALAAKGVGGAAERFVTSKRMGREIERDTEIFFRLEMEGLVVSEPEQSIFWDGVIDSVTFNVGVPDDFAPRAVISNVIFGTVNDEGQRAVIGHVNFTFEVAAEAAPATLPASAQAAGVVTTAGGVATERPPQTQVDHDCAFISYASEEREEVLKIVRGIMADGTRCLMDKLTFKTGEEWEAAIRRDIAESDVFYLFWSTEASKSEWVQKEIDLALEKQREFKVRPLILPMPLEDTSRVAPPEKLRHLHFDDPVLDRTELEKYRRSLQPPSPPQN
jgi:hypothetical protein